MKINVESSQEGGANFVNFTHVRDGESFHTYIRLQDVKSWESLARSGRADKTTRWRLATVQGDVYYTLNTFNEIMTTNKWYPRPGDGSGIGRVDDRYLYRPEKVKASL